MAFQRFRISAHRTDPFEQQEPDLSSLLGAPVPATAPLDAFDGTSELGQMPPGLTPYAPTEPVGRIQTRPPRYLRALPPPPLPDVLSEPRHASNRDEKTPICDETAHGWRHLRTIRCDFPAATHDTPIPCDAEYADDQAVSFAELKESAWVSGWRVDDWDRWACPWCAQTNTAFRTARPVMFWADGAAEARDQRLAVDLLHPDGTPVTTPDGRVVTIAGEHALRAQAEQWLFEDVLAAAHRPGRHRSEVTA